MGRNFAWKPERGEQSKHGVSGIVEELVGALRLVHMHAPLLWAIVAGGFISAAWSAAFVVGAPLLADRVLHANVGAYGFIVGAYGVGNVLSNLVVDSLTIKRRVMMMLVGKLVVAGGFLFMGSIPVLPVALLGSALAALGGPMEDIPILMMMQMDLPANSIGKIYSLRITISEAGSALGLLLAAPLYHYLSVPMAIICCALVFATTSVLGLMRFGFAEPVIKNA